MVLGYRVGINVHSPCRETGGASPGLLVQARPRNTPSKNAHCPSYCVRPNWLLYSGQDITLLFAGCCTDEKAPRLPCRMCSSPLRTAQPIDFLCHICSRLALFTVRQQQMAFTAMKPPP